MFVHQASTSKARFIDVDMDGNGDSSDNEETSFQVDDDDMFCDVPAARRQISEMCKRTTGLACAAGRISRHE